MHKQSKCLFVPISYDVNLNNVYFVVQFPYGLILCLWIVCDVQYMCDLQCICDVQYILPAPTIWHLPN